jgi:transglycosylase-like protein with SLT domain
MTEWILALMLSLASLEGPAEWRDTYRTTAIAIADVARETPLFEGDDGRKTAALLVAIAWHESRFRQDAVGDKGRSHCLVQISNSNFDSLGVTREELQDPKVCLRAGIRMIKESFRVCREYPLLERLGWYASGGAGCRGTRASRLRMGLAQKLAKQ